MGDDIVYTFTTPKGRYLVGGACFDHDEVPEAREAREARDLWKQAQSHGETDRVSWAKRIAREAREARETHQAQVVLARWRIAQQKS